MKSIVVASALATVAFAANSSTTSPLIPTSNISPGCATYLDQLNSDSSLSSCLSSINTATADFGPTASKAADASAVTSSLAKLCASDSCDKTTLHSTLAAFNGACQSELISQNANPDVITMYDSLYMIWPMKDALCSKSNGAYCVTTLASSASASSKRDLEKREVQAVLKPNAQTYNQENVAMLRLSPSAPHDVLCGNCSRQVQQAWIDQMNSLTYGPGIANSKMFSGQASLYNTTTSTCGTDFFSTGSNVNNVGGGLAGGVIKASGAVSTRAVSSLAGLAGAAVLVALAL